MSNGSSNGSLQFEKHGPGMDGAEGEGKGEGNGAVSAGSRWSSVVPLLRVHRAYW